MQRIALQQPSFNYNRPESCHVLANAGRATVDELPPATCLPPTAVCTPAAAAGTII